MHKLGNIQTRCSGRRAKGHLNVIQLLLERGTDVHAPCGKYPSALYAALSGGHTEMVRLLRDNGAPWTSQPY
jgi:hypothetical protein